MSEIETEMRGKTALTADNVDFVDDVDYAAVSQSASPSAATTVKVPSSFSLSSSSIEGNNNNNLEVRAQHRLAKCLRLQTIC